MNTERESFEKAWPVPIGVALNTHTGWYEATQPYHWGADNSANHHNSLWCGWIKAWQHKAATISDLELQLCNTQYERNEVASELMHLEQQNRELREAVRVADTVMRDDKHLRRFPVVFALFDKALAGQESGR
jgi:hypothetical protein